MSDFGSSSHHYHNITHHHPHHYDPRRIVPAQTVTPLSPPLTPDELQQGVGKDAMAAQEPGSYALAPHHERKNSDAIVMGYDSSKDMVPQSYLAPSASSSSSSSTFSPPNVFTPPPNVRRTSVYEPIENADSDPYRPSSSTSANGAVTPLNGLTDLGYGRPPQDFYSRTGNGMVASTSKDSGYGGAQPTYDMTITMDQAEAGGPHALSSPVKDDSDAVYHPSSSTTHHRITSSTLRHPSPQALPNLLPSYPATSSNSSFSGYPFTPPSSHSNGNPYATTPESPPHSVAYTSGRSASPSREKGLAHPLTSTPTMDQPKVGFTDSPAYWLALYFFFNLGLTLFNKVVLVSFPFPYTLTGLHALSGCLGCYMALEQGHFQPARLTPKENMIMAAFSVLYTINIAVSNLSLQLVTVPFHQVVRASTPLFTILISTIFLRTQFSTRKLISLLPVVAGVGFATYGDYYFTVWGLILTLIGTFLAALKTVVTNVIQTGGGGRLKLHPLDLLMRMSPLAFIQCVIYGWWSGELERVRRYGALEMTRGKAIALLVNGIIAFGLNIVSFTANKKAGALTMTVSANCKQVLTIAIAVVLFDLKIAVTNGIGILLTLVGGAWYAYIEYLERSTKRLGKLVERE